MKLKEFEKLRKKLDTKKATIEINARKLEWISKTQTYDRKYLYIFRLSGKREEIEKIFNTLKTGDLEALERLIELKRMALHKGENG